MRKYKPQQGLTNPGYLRQARQSTKPQDNTITLPINRPHLPSPTHPSHLSRFPETAPVDHVTSKDHNYLTDQAASFWHEQIPTKGMPGTTVVHDATNPYRKDAKFSTPLDDLRTGVASGQMCSDLRRVVVMVTGIF